MESKIQSKMCRNEFCTIDGEHPYNPKTCSEDNIIKENHEIQGAEEQVGGQSTSDSLESEERELRAVCKKFSGSNNDLLNIDFAPDKKDMRKLNLQLKSYEDYRKSLSEPSSAPPPLNLQSETPPVPAFLSSLRPKPYPGVLTSAPSDRDLIRIINSWRNPETLTIVAKDPGYLLQIFCETELLSCYVESYKLAMSYFMTLPFHIISTLAVNMLQTITPMNLRQFESYISGMMTGVKCRAIEAIGQVSEDMESSTRSFKTHTLELVEASRTVAETVEQNRINANMLSQLVADLKLQISKSISINPSVYPPPSERTSPLVKSGPLVSEKFIILKSGFGIYAFTEKGVLDPSSTLKLNKHLTSKDAELLNFLSMASLTNLYHVLGAPWEIIKRECQLNISRHGKTTDALSAAYLSLASIATKYPKPAQDELTLASTP